MTLKKGVATNSEAMRGLLLLLAPLSACGALLAAPAQGGQCRVCPSL